MKKARVDFLSALDRFDFLNVGTVYIVDFENQRFIYVSSSNLPLCGYSREEVLKSDFFNFYRTLAWPTDRAVVERILASILARVKGQDAQASDVKYFSFDLRVGVRSQILKKSGYLMTHHTLTPVSTGRQTLLGVGLVTGSSQKKSGNLRIYYNSHADFFDEYSGNTGEWTRQKVKSLTEKEKWALIFSKQNLSNKQIAAKLDVEYSTLRKINMNICKKLGVETMLQATHAPAYSPGEPRQNKK
jgi:DNA-binding CsgD family transcriptional regulator